MSYPWYLTLAAIGGSLCLAIALAFDGVWWGDRSSAREYRARTRLINQPPVQPWPFPSPPTAPVLDHGKRRRYPRLPLPAGTPVPGIPLTGSYRRNGGQGNQVPCAVRRRTNARAELKKIKPSMQGEQVKP